MGTSIYNGTSDGFDELQKGYIDYAKEIIARRSVPDIRDGLKPVSRRIVYACSSTKGIFDSLTKSATLVGRVMDIHPHGDASIYQTMCSMTDKYAGMNVPLFCGQGNFGKVHSVDGAAAMRYTKAKLSDVARDYLRDMDACTMVQSEEGEGYEPEVFPVRFPSALVNGTSGMAVSVSTSIPSFNMLDVINLTQEYIKNGEMKSIITPDFPTGGVIVKDDTEIAKIMHTGKGKLKIRAKVEIEGKDIFVKEVPFGKTVEGILSAIDKSEISGIQSTSDGSGQNSDNLIIITCKTLKVVESVLMQLYKHRILQTTFSSNMLFVYNGEPVMTGVYGVVEKWVAWRRGIVIKKFEKAIEGVDSEIRNLSYFIRLVSNAEWRDSYTDVVIHNSKQAGREYLKSIFDDIPDDVASWIAERPLSAFNNGGKYINRYSELEQRKQEYHGYIENVDDYIYSDLEELKATRSEYMKRRTLETYKDYRFSKISDNDIEDDSFCVYTLYSDGFLTKTRDTVPMEGKVVVAQISAQANSTLIGFDCFGRVLRVFGTDIAFTGWGDNGEYLPRYFEAEGYDGYRIVYLGLLDGTTRMLVYRDGFVGFLDTSEWVGKKKVRVVQRGVDVNVYDKLLEVYEEEDYPEYLVVADDHTGKVRFGVTQVSSIRRASRKSRAKVFSGDNIDLHYIMGIDYMGLMKFMESPFFYMDRVRPLSNREVYGNPEDLKDGRYYGK